MSGREGKIGKNIEIIFDSETPDGVQKIKGIREKNPKSIIVFATGCMDVVQPGHPIFIEQIRMLGEKIVDELGKTLLETKVIVVFGIGRDSTLRTLKSRGRPINEEMNRAYVVASYRDVDYVILNNKEIREGKIDFEGVLKILRPDVFVLNSDDSAIEMKKRLCEDVGILFKTVDRIVPEFLIPTSSTAIIEKIKNLRD